MRAIALSLILAIVSCSLAANDDDHDLDHLEFPVWEDNLNLIDLKGSPDSIVGGCVSVISGHYFENAIDLIIPGPCPVEVQRFFNSAKQRKKGKICYGWRFNHTDTLYLGIQTVDHHTPSGDTYVYKSKHRDKWSTYTLDKNQLKYGVTNASGRFLGGTTNVLNRTFKGGPGAKYTYLKMESGERLTYRRKHKTDEDYYLKKKKFPNGCYQTFQKTSGMKFEHIRSFGKKGNSLCGLHWIYPKNLEKTAQVVVQASNGREVAYQFKNSILEQVIYDDGLTITYDYTFGDKKERLKRKNFPGGNYLDLKFYEKGKNFVGQETVKIKDLDDRRIGRISTLLAPVGVDHSPYPLYTFRYNFEKKSKKAVSGTTEVRDASGHKTHYIYSKEQRLTSIKEYTKKGKTYRKDCIFWGRKKTPVYTFLLSRGLQNASGNYTFCRRYDYDHRGNVLAETLAGNLSGLCSIHPQLSDAGDLIENGCEKYVKRYTYTKDNLIKTENDGRKTIVYSYYPHTHLLRLKLIRDGKTIRERYYYEYDENGANCLTIADDGNSNAIDDFSGVTERRVTRIKATTAIPIGLPQKIQECYLDFSTGQEKLLKRTVNTYSPEGYLLREEVYDCHDVYAYAKIFEYHKRGYVLKETDPLGQTTVKSYDAAGNCVRMQTPNRNVYTTYLYDYANRLIRESACFADGKILTKTFAYDKKGNRVSEVDCYGNETQFFYDEHNRLIEKISPAHTSEKVTYDIVNLPVAKTDANGHTTEVVYTSWGHPHTVKHPDGSIEKKIYNLDGTLRKTIDVNGVETVFTYDYQRRKIREEVDSHEGKRTWQWKYNAFHLVEEVDPEGFSTTYQFDEAGRLVSEKKGGSETHYLYDSLGRQHEAWQLYAEENFRKTKITFDLLDRILEETIVDGKTVVSRKTYAYDADGNQILASRDTDAGHSSTYMEYDTHNKLVRIIKPAGEETFFRYHYAHINAQGQTVPYQEEIDPKGNVKAQEMDTFGRLILEEVKNCLGDIVKRTEYRYDGANNLTARVEHVMIGQKTTKTLVTAFEYDACDRQIAVIEAVGEPEQKITRKRYTSAGQVAEAIKPDGTILTHHYDVLNRLIALESSDHSIHYQYTYDFNDHVIAVENVVTKTITQRQFDAKGNVTQEKLENGASMSYQYDPLDRLVHIRFPDASTVSYGYDARFLRTVRRDSKKHQYVVEYDYDISGRVKTQNMPNGLGTIDFQSDLNLRPRQTLSSYWSEHIVDYDPCDHVVTIQHSDSIGEETSHFAYDALHQLIAEKGAAQHTYQFDSVRNRVTKDDAAYRHNALNQLMSQKEKKYRYDANGNLVERVDGSDKVHYQYDALDRLVAVVKSREKIVYHYDAFHRRLSKTFYRKMEKGWEVDSREHYLYLGEREVGTINDDMSCSQLRIFGLENNGDIGSTVAMEIDGQLLIPLHDYRGHIACLIDAKNRKIVDNYRYSAYGEEMVDHASLSPWRFSSKRIDPETGWVYFGRRYYDPEVGRWTTPDPLWFEDGPNLYCYVHNRPSLFVDQDGLFLGSLFGDLLLNFLAPHFECIAGGMALVWSMRYGIGGHQPEHSTSFPVQGLQDRNVVYTAINGMNNSRMEAVKNAEYASNLGGGVEVKGIYNASFGLMLDCVRAFFGYRGFSPDPVKLLQEQWSNVFRNGNEKTIIVHLCHSEGAIQTINALKGFNHELRKRIRVIAVAPAQCVEESYCGKAINLISKKEHVFGKGDFIHGFNFLGGGRLPENVEALKPHPNAPWWDHDFQSETYRDRIKFFLKEFSSK